jgi:hypothetical protein
MFAVGRLGRIAMARPSKETSGAVSRWATFKDRLGIAGVIVALVLLFYFMFEGSIMNFQCSFTEFLSFKCNRYDARPRPWDQIKHRD